MGQLIRFADFSKSRRSPQTGAARDEPRPGYFCTRCNGDTFLLAACGQINCAHCGALMRNIEVFAPAQRREGEAQPDGSSRSLTDSRPQRGLNPISPA